MKSIGRSIIVDVKCHEFENLALFLRMGLRDSMTFDRGRWQSQDVSARPEMRTHELWNVHIEYHMPATLQELVGAVSPNLPWAEDHFQERVSGEPLNPPPSNEWWPYAQRGNSAHKGDGIKFSHTYPERFWPKYTGAKVLRADRLPSGEYQYWDGGIWDVSGTEPFLINIPDEAYEHKKRQGIRFDYGDLSDVIDLLKRDPFTRQAYLPVWFPEDTGAVHGERVPCSLGYHFVRNGSRLDCNYFMRSCDFFRHFRDDVYMAVRLAWWVHEKIGYEGDWWPTIGRLNMFISNLHCFSGDKHLLES